MTEYIISQTTFARNETMDLINRIQKYALTCQTYANIMTLENRLITQTDNHTVDNHTVDNHTVDNHTVDNHTVDNHTVDNHTVDNHTVDNHTVDNHKIIASCVTTSTKNCTNKKDYSVNVKDQLFWCLLMLTHSWEESDLPAPRDRFEIESKEKTLYTELLQKSDTIPWKELKLSKTTVCTNLGSSINGKIDIDELRALAFLCEKNIAYVWGKCCIKIPGRRAISNNEWNVIIRQRSGYKLATDMHANEIMKKIDDEEYYYVEDPNKPLMSITSYKLADLQSIAAKLNIDTQNGKKAKLKKELYQEIIDCIHKID